jgi:hypothetical protein
MEVVKVGRRGTIIVPAKLRKRYGISRFCYVVEQWAEEDVGRLCPPIRPTAPIHSFCGLSWSPGLTGAILPCSYRNRLSLANCDTAVVSH